MLALLHLAPEGLAFSPLTRTSKMQTSRVRMDTEATRDGEPGMMDVTAWQTAALAKVVDTLSLAEKEYAAELGYDSFSLAGTTGSVRSYEGSGAPNVAWCSGLELPGSRSSISAFCGPLTDVTPSLPHAFSQPAAPSRALRSLARLPRRTLVLRPALRLLERRCRTLSRAQASRTAASTCTLTGGRVRTRPTTQRALLRAPTSPTPPIAHLAPTSTATVAHTPPSLSRCATLADYPEPSDRNMFSEGSARKDFASCFYTEDAEAWRNTLLAQGTTLTPTPTLTLALNLTPTLTLTLTLTLT